MVTSGVKLGLLGAILFVLLSVSFAAAHHSYTYGNSYYGKSYYGNNYWNNYNSYSYGKMNYYNSYNNRLEGYGVVAWRNPYPYAGSRYIDNNYVRGHCSSFRHGCYSAVTGYMRTPSYQRPVNSNVFYVHGNHYNPNRYNWA